MVQEKKNQQPGGIPATQGADSESHVNTNGGHRQNGQKPNTSLPSAGNSESEIVRSVTDDLPLSDNGTAGPVATVLLTKDSFEILLTDSSEDATEIVANTDFHALFIKDEVASSYLDRYSEATGDPNEDLSTGGSSLQPQESSGLFPPLVERMQNKSPHTKVLLTVKKMLPTDLYTRAQKYINLLCTRLGMSDHDRKLIAGAGDVHILAKFRHPDQSFGVAKSVSDTDVRSFRFLNAQPIVVRILRSMYGNLEKKDSQQQSIELMGANVLTIVDLFCDTVHFEENMTRDRLQTVSRELGNLTGKLFLKDVFEAFITILQEEVIEREAHEKSNRVMIYSDRRDRVYPLESRLRNEGFQATTFESLESFAQICKRRRPNVIMIRLHSSPRDIIKTLQYLSGRGIDLNSIPTFLLVKGTVVHRLGSLIEIGIEDIIDLDGNIDVLMLKIKKVRAKFETSSKSLGDLTQQQSGSRGNLSDMNLIDLLQALGPSQRTAKITIKSEDSPSEPLLIYLTQGNITFAQLGELSAESAIYQALGWEKGSWSVEQITEEDLPEPNNDLSNESILMEGCRLLDENARKSVVS